MTLHDTPLAHLRRPRLLVSAARFGLSAFRRDAGLSRIFQGHIPHHGTAALDALAALEADQDTARRDGMATYSVARHIEILTALMAEARLTLDSASAPAGIR